MATLIEIEQKNVGDQPDWLLMDLSLIVSGDRVSSDYGVTCVDLRRIA